MNDEYSGTVASGLAAWSSGLDASSLDSDVVRAATCAMIDTVGVALAGAHMPLSRTVSLITELETQPGEATVFTCDSRLKATGAAFVNSVAAHLLDFDDTHFDGIVHASCVILPAVLACAEQHGSSTPDLLSAFVAGSEVTYALGRALEGMFWRGWWNTAVLSSIGAAAGSARALRLDEERSAHAIAIASCFTFGERAILGCDTNALGAGLAAQAGVRAALLAAAGVCGPLDAIEHKNGLAATFNNGRLDRSQLRKLGRQFALTHPGLAFKLYPACSGAQAAAQAIHNLVEREGISSGQVSRVVCAVTPLVAENLRFPDPADLTQAQFSLPFAIGCLLSRRQFGPEELSEEWLRSASLRTEMTKVEMHVTEDLVPPTKRDLYPEAAQVTCVLTDGREVSQTVLAARGMPDDPLDDDVLDRKFMTCTSSLLSREDAHLLLDRLHNLISPQPVRSLFASLRLPTRRA